MKAYYVYVLTNSFHNVLYVGVTNDLSRRLQEHKQKLIAGFSAKYNTDILVYYENFDDVNEAITREKQIKSYRREKKNKLIASTNPHWADLSLEWL
ncbi:GIY-YIG nuclease family protein [bacterium]|nr:GIY-YIG nuclease family protein [bacterium]